MAFEKIYQTESISQTESLKYIFISQGVSDIIKAIEYIYVQDFMASPLFNLGFGDYDIESDTISDKVVSNNGDHYVVFHTVLSTIPEFFQKYPHATMMVQGSDHGTDFANKCRETCHKNCRDRCKNTGRRIAAYRGYVNKNFEELIKTYTFLVGLKVDNEQDNKILIEPYKKDKDYESVFCKLKQIPLHHAV